MLLPRLVSIVLLGNITIVTATDTPPCGGDNNKVKWIHLSDMTVDASDRFVDLDGTMPQCRDKCLLLQGCRSLAYCNDHGQSRCEAASERNRSLGLHPVEKPGCSYMEWTCEDAKKNVHDVYYLRSPLSRPIVGQPDVSSLPAPSQIACAVLCSKRKCTSFDYISTVECCYYVTDANINLRYSARLSQD